MDCVFQYKVKVAATLPEQSDLWRYLPESWQYQDYKKDLTLIAQKIGMDFQPSIDQIFACFKNPPESIKVVIVGQDPYPKSEHAMGLAFSVPTEIVKLPPTLINIFKELKDDLGVVRQSGNLTDWSNQGVMLLNRTLTIARDGKNSHINLGWEDFTEKIIQRLAQRSVKAILWGNQAQKLRNYFPEKDLIATAHPSPLSAYRGFFGSKPFSRINRMLIVENKLPINW